MRPILPAAALLLACASDPPKPAPSPFVGTFTQRTDAGVTTVRLTGDGHAEYVNSA